MIRTIGLSALLLLTGGRAFAFEQPYQVGIASVYWEDARVATGARFNKLGPTVAHRELPFGTIVQITVIGTKRKAWATVNDRGPFIKGRVIDLSLGTAQRLGLGRSLARVRIDIVCRGHRQPLEPMFAREALEKLEHVSGMRYAIRLASTKQWQP